MLYFSIDTETTGRDPKKDQILEFAIIFEDTTKPTSYAKAKKLSIILDHDRIEGGASSLSMNKRLLDILAEYHSLEGDAKALFREKHTIIKPKDLYPKVVFFISKCLNITASELGKTTINLAGKNIATFDLLFMQKIMNLKTGLNVCRRILDPAILFMDTYDNFLPDLDLCKRRAGLLPGIKHIAIKDAWDVIELIRIGSTHE